MGNLTLHRRGRSLITAAVWLLSISVAGAGEPPPEPGWQEVTCDGCDYSLTVPAFGYPLEVWLRPTGGRIENYDQSKLRVLSDGFLELKPHQYYLEIDAEPARFSLEQAKTVCSRFLGKPRPLNRPEPSFRCRIDGLGGDSTHSDYAEVRVGDRAYTLAIDAHQLSRETVDRIFESLVIRGPSAPPPDR